MAACNLGVALEGFDFIAYSAFAAIFARLYFPADSALAATLLTFGGFATAYLARPLGGLFWGLYADRNGRRAALAWTAILMALGTGLIAVTPPYTAIGMAAPALILVARLLQGFAVSGEFASATAMLVEVAPPGRRALYASTQMATQVLTAGLAAGIVLALTLLLPQSAVENWGWRLVFALGTMIGPVGFWMRSRMAESPVYQALTAAHRTARAPLREIFGRFPSELLGMAGLIVISSAALYLILIFLPLYAVRELGIAPVDTQISTIVATSAEALVILGCGRLADRVGALPVLACGAAAYTLAIWPLFAALVAAPSFAALLAVQLAAAVLLGVISAPLPFAMSRLLPPEVRTTGIGLIYNTVGAVFGGLGPLIVTALVAATGDKAAPGWWAAATGATGAIAAFWLWRQHKEEAR
uniref:MFS transporter n=1 Tax=Altererythrobacter segetis TaxID=1104773 RepID=UPI0024345FF0|nr:MFS transporter [Altererythrobacter segetis]